MWKWYCTILWTVRCYAWNPFYYYLGKYADYVFNQADWQVRKRMR